MNELEILRALALVAGQQQAGGSLDGRAPRPAAPPTHCSPSWPSWPSSAPRQQAAPACLPVRSARPRVVAGASP